MDDAQKARTRRTIMFATMAPAMATAVKRYLRDTPEYERARAEGRGAKWLDREAQSLGYALAEVIKERLDNLEG